MVRSVAFVLLAGLLVSPSSSARICGDVDSSGTVNDTLDYLAYFQELLGVAVGASIFDEGAADLDDVTGISFADAAIVANHIWGDDTLAYDCLPSSPPSFGAFAGPDLRILALTDIPDGVDTVSIELVLRRDLLALPFAGVNIPLLETSPEFAFAQVQYFPGTPVPTPLDVVARDFGHDTIQVAGVLPAIGPVFEQVILIDYVRVAPGVSDLIVQPVSSVNGQPLYVTPPESDLVVPSVVFTTLDYLTACCTNCGDVNLDGGVGLPDLSRLIDYLFITFAPLRCPSTTTCLANSDAPGLPDLASLIDNLFISFTPLPPCP